MVTLFDKIKYHHKFYSELNDSIGRLEIEKLAAKLKSLETEIVNDPKGMITIMQSGNIFFDSFNRDLAEKISKIVSGVRHL